MVDPLELPSSSESACCRRLAWTDRYSANPNSTVPFTERPAAPVIWYCCMCGHGPMNQQLYLACINCDHQGCSRCSSDPPSKQGAPAPDGQNSSNSTYTVTEYKGSNSPLHNMHSIDKSTTPAPEQGSVLAPAAGSHLEGEWLWNCHLCTEGPMTVSIHKNCINCGHVRCDDCPLYAT